MLLRKPRSFAEVYNDLDGEIVNVFRTLRDRGAELTRLVAFTPYSREEFLASFREADDPLEAARRTLVRSHMGFGGNLTRPNSDGNPQRTGFRDYTGRDRRTIAAHDWATLPAALPAIASRFRGVVIEQRDALEVMAKHDGPRTLHYVDPTYVHETRRCFARGKRGYRHELSNEEHVRLIRFCHQLEGAVVLSGYDCPLYAEQLGAGWRKVSRPAMAEGARPRVETLWLRNTERLAA